MPSDPSWSRSFVKLHKKLQKATDEDEKRTFTHCKEYVKDIKKNFVAFNLDFVVNPSNLIALSNVFGAYLNILSQIESLYQKDIQKTKEVQNLKVN